jgi:hypothetical protein
MSLPGLYLPTPSYPVNCVYTAGTSSGTDANTYTWSSTAIGPADPRRVVVACVFMRDAGGGSPDTTNLAIDASPMTEIIEFAGTATYAVLAYLNWPTGTTAEFTHNVGLGGANIEQVGIAVWSLYGLSSLTPLDSDNAGTGTNFANTLTSQPGGVAIHAYINGVAGQLGDPTFSIGTADFTVEVETAVRFAAAHRTTTGFTDTNTMTCGTGGRGLCASWR